MSNTLVKSKFEEMTQLQRTAAKQREAGGNLARDRALELGGV